MAETTGISWADATVNFWHGCKKVSAGCKYCYMYRDKTRYGQDPTKVIRAKPSTFTEALRWPEGKKIFTCSWSDFFIQEADEWRPAAWEIIKKTPQHSWLILTKRIERVAEHLPLDWGDGYPNVWLGVSAENQATALDRIPKLLVVPAVVRFVSFEPLLGPISLWDMNAGFTHALGAKRLHWAILGGESGNETGDFLYRDAELEWFDKLAVDLDANSVPVFVKQLGTGLRHKLGLSHRAGAEPQEWPLNLQRQEFPQEGINA